MKKLHSSTNTPEETERQLAHMTLSHRIALTSTEVRLMDIVLKHLIQSGAAPTIELSPTGSLYATTGSKASYTDASADVTSTICAWTQKTHGNGETTMKLMAVRTTHSSPASKLTASIKHLLVQTTLSGSLSLMALTLMSQSFLLFGLLKRYILPTITTSSENYDIMYTDL